MSINTDFDDQLSKARRYRSEAIKKAFDVVEPRILKLEAELANALKIADQALNRVAALQTAARELIVTHDRVDHWKQCNMHLDKLRVLLNHCDPALEQLRHDERINDATVQDPEADSEPLL